MTYHIDCLSTNAYLKNDVVVTKWFEKENIQNIVKITVEDLYL